MPFFGDYNEALLSSMHGKHAPGRSWGTAFGRTHGRLARTMGAPFRGAASAYRGARSAVSEALAGSTPRGWASSTGAMLGGLVGFAGGGPVGGAIGAGIGGGAGYAALTGIGPRAPAMHGPQQYFPGYTGGSAMQTAVVNARKMRNKMGTKMRSFGGRAIGGLIAGGVGGAVFGPGIGLIAGASVMAPKKMGRLGAGAAGMAASGIGGIFRSATLGAAGSGGIGRTLAGAAVGGMMGGLPGVGVGGFFGAVGGMKALGNTTPARKLLSMAGRHPGKTAGALGLMLSVPTIVRGLFDAIRPDPILPDVAPGSLATIYGMDANNHNTLGLTLALHYRR